MRGPNSILRLGVGTVWLKGTMFRAESRIVALTTASSLTSRFSKSKKNEALFLVIGPLRLPPYWREEYGARVGANGLRALKAMLLKLKEVWPRNLSVPGLVRISIRPNPGRSYSAENGFALILISRIDASGGRFPPVKPSMKI